MEFHFGTDAVHLPLSPIVREMDSKVLPYQELTRSVRVWHTTCIRRGQTSIQIGNGKTTSKQAFRFIRASS